MDRDKTILDYLDYIRLKVVKYYYSYGLSNYCIDYEDLYQDVLLFVYTYLDNFDLNKSKFITYLNNLINYGIITCINSNNSFVSIPRNVKIDAHNLKKERSRFYKKNNRNMSISEMIDYVKNRIKNNNVTVDEKYIKNLLYIEKCCFNDKAISLDNDMYANNSDEENMYEYATLSDDISDNIDYEELVVEYDKYKRVIDYLKELDPNNSPLYIDYLGLEDGVSKTIESMARKNNVSHQAISNRIKTMKSKINTREKKLRKMISE